MLRSSKGNAAAPAERARYSCRVHYADLETDLDALIEKAVGAVAASSSAPDAILGDFLGLASRIRAVSFHEGRLLEQAIDAIGQRTPTSSSCRRRSSCPSPRRHWRRLPTTAPAR